MLNIFLFVIDFIFLIKGADWLVSGASALASKLGVSALVIGLTIVAFGTSAPELTVNLLASFQGNTDIAIGNILGSNIANILLILGISAIIYPLAVQKGTVWREIPFAVLAVVVLAIMANDVFIDGSASSALTRIDGLLLLSFFTVFLYYIFSIAKKPASAVVEEDEIPAYTTTRSTLMIIGGLIGLVIGGKWIVDGAVMFATQLNISEALIGLTVIAIGTSLPELATSAVAAYKRNVDIAIGNVIGSNIFNIFWILGVSASITPLSFSSDLTTDLIIVIVVTVLLFLALFVGQRHTLEKWQGWLFVACYFSYIVFLVIRG